MEFEPKAVVDELEDRQKQFGVLLDVSPEKLKGLEFCNTCDGEDYEWTDWSLSGIDVGGLEIASQEEAIDYRIHLAESSCKECDGTGFEGGNFKLTTKEWEKLGKEIG